MEDNQISLNRKLFLTKVATDFQYSAIDATEQNESDDRESFSNSNNRCDKILDTNLQVGLQLTLPLNIHKKASCQVCWEREVSLSLFNYIWYTCI